MKTHRHVVKIFILIILTTTLSPCLLQAQDPPSVKYNQRNGFLYLKPETLDAISIVVESDPALNPVGLKEGQIRYQETWNYQRFANREQWAATGADEPPTHHIPFNACIILAKYPTQLTATSFGTAEISTLTQGTTIFPVEIVNVSPGSMGLCKKLYYSVRFEQQPYN